MSFSVSEFSMSRLQTYLYASDPPSILKIHIRWSTNNKKKMMNMYLLWYDICELEELQMLGTGTSYSHQGANSNHRLTKSKNHVSVKWFKLKWITAVVFNQHIYVFSYISFYNILGCILHWSWNSFNQS